MRAIVIIMSILSFLSCSNQEEYKIKIVNNFPIEKILTREVIKIDHTSSCAKELIISANYLTIINRDLCDNYYFDVYDKENFILLNSFGTRGRGPTDLLAPMFTNEVVFSDTIIGFWIKNQKNFNYELINIEKSLQSGYYFVEASFQIPRSNGLGSLAYKTKDEAIIVRSLNGEEGRFYLYDPKNQATKWVHFFPSVPNVPFDYMTLLYYGQTGVSRCGDYFIATSTYFKRIEIFNVKLDHQVSIKYQDSPNLKFSANSDPDFNVLMWHFSGIYFSDNKFYVLQIKRPGNITPNNKNRIENGEVHVFSYCGEPIARYLLSDKPSSFAIDEQNGFIFCISDSEEGITMTKYKMPS